MSITTKTGDTGLTSLFSGERVPKDDLRVDAYGTVDELDAHLADAFHYVEDVQIQGILRDIHTQLGHVMAVLASTDEPTSKHSDEAVPDRLTQPCHPPAFNPASLIERIRAHPVILSPTLCATHVPLGQPVTSEALKLIHP